MTRFLTAILFLSFILVPVNSWAKGGPQVCTTKTCFDVEIVSNEKDMARGLSGRKGLRDGRGMLFVFPREGKPRFWMKDMRFALDIIWIDTAGKVVAVASGLKPCKGDDCPLYVASRDARYVLELNAGSAAKHKIAEGSDLKMKLE